MIQLVYDCGKSDKATPIDCRGPLESSSIQEFSLIPVSVGCCCLKAHSNTVLKLLTLCFFVCERVVFLLLTCFDVFQSIDPWAALDPHDPGTSQARPVRKGRTYKLPPQLRKRRGKKIHEGEDSGAGGEEPKDVGGSWVGHAGGLL